MSYKTFVLLALLMVAGLSFAQYGYQQDNNQDERPRETLSVDLDSSCEGNAITVESNGDPVSGVDVTVIDVAGGAIFSGNTDENGSVSFKGCGMDIIIHVSRSGYFSESISEKLIDCAQCEAPECTTNDQCPATDACVEQECKPVDCPCGARNEHRCDAYQCCSDDDCGGNEQCQNNVCKPRFECTSDVQCAVTKYCNITVGAAGGRCADVIGCGKVENHKLVPYECGTEPGCPACPQGEVCADHACVASDLKGPASGFIGDEAGVEASEEDKPCVNCDLQITDPEGNIITGKTNETGGFELPLTLKGTYQVALLKNGQVVKIIQINSLPKATPETPETPTATSPGLDAPLIGLLLLLILIIGGIIYMATRGGAKK